MSVYEQHRVSQPLLQGQLGDLFTYDVCVVAQATQLVLAELCDALQAGHQHVVHVWHTDTHTHTHTHTYTHCPRDLWLTHPVTLQEDSVNAELRNNRGSIRNPLLSRSAVLITSSICLKYVLSYMFMILIHAFNTVGLWANSGVIKRSDTEVDHHISNLSVTPVISLDRLFTNM